MKPSEIENELEAVKRNPKLLLISILLIVIVSFTGFYFSKFLSGELSECKSPKYKLEKTEVCGVLEYKSSTGKQCGVDTYNRCESGGACGYKGPFKTNANSCRDQVCGVEKYKTCKHSDFGVSQYKACMQESHGLEICEDSPPWMFWKK